MLIPQKVRFRYRLEGYETDWHDAGTRRQAFYTDLPPGKYSFRVIASDSDGVWSDSAARLGFFISPAYYQTSWFRAASAAILALLLWAGYRVRVGVIERHEAQISALNERLMKAQEQERMRIAGELHDGVMQQISAFVLLLGTAKRRMKVDLDAIADVASVQQKLIELGSEVRQLSHDLHPAALKDTGLPEALRAYCAEFSQARGIPWSYEADAERERPVARLRARAVPHRAGGARQRGEACRADADRGSSDSHQERRCADGHRRRRRRRRGRGGARRPRARQHARAGAAAERHVRVRQQAGTRHDRQRANPVSLRQRSFVRRVRCRRRSTSCAGGYARLSRGRIDTRRAAESRPS